MASVAHFKKTDKANLEQYRVVFFLVGLVFTLGLLLVAFEHKTVETPTYNVKPNDTANFYVAKEVYMFKPIQQTLPKPIAPKPINKPKVTPKKVEPIKVEPVVVPPVEIPPPDEPKPMVVDTSTAKNTDNNTAEEALPANRMKIDKAAQFPGGALALEDFVRTNLQYPQFARQNGYAGTVIAQFIVEPNGSLSNITITKNVRGSKFDEEATRLVKAMPLWEPAVRKGQPIKSMYTLPIQFILE